MPPRKKQTKTATVKKEAAKKAQKRKEPTPSTPSTPAKRGKKSVKNDPDAGTSTSKDEAGDVKKRVFTGQVPVDEHCEQCQTDFRVFSELGTIYNAMLNQTNIGENNNKYYVLQILQHTSKPEYVLWFRWGRVGKVAGTTFKNFGGDRHGAIRAFQKKFQEKTGFPWVFRSAFIKTKGKYDMIEMDYGVNRDPTDIKKAGSETKGKVVPSKLDKRVGDVIDLLFDVNEFETAVREMKYDVKKAPLGKLTPQQIKAGYESLKKIDTCIRNKDFGPGNSKLEEACSEFYTRIPHDFGMKRPPLISTTEELKAKLQLLEALGEIQIAVQMMKNEDTSKENPKDARYKSLGCKLEPIEKKNKDFKLVKDYVAKSHGSTHSQYTLEVQEVFKVERDQDEKRFKKKIGNRMLLWHGSRLTNWCGILKQGLRIAPPEAPVCGYMFGKGVYFADMVSKSANYCFTSKRQPTGFLLLCEVALGNTSDKIHGDYHADKLPKGHHSTKGLGQEIPDPKGSKQLDCGTTVPLGRPKIVPSHNYHLRYNEYIVYDVAQIRPRYLVKARFVFRGW